MMEPALTPRIAEPRRARPGALARLAEATASWWRLRSVSPFWTAFPALSAPFWRCRWPPSRRSPLTAPANVWPQLARTVLPSALLDTAVLLLGRGPAHPHVRGLHRVARHHVPLSRAGAARPPAGAAAGHADLHRGLCLRRAARLCGARAGGVALAVRLAVRQGLLVPRRAQHGRRHPGAVGGALSLRLSLGAGELRAAVGVRAGGGAHAWAAPRPACCGRWRCPWRGRRWRAAWRWWPWSASTTSAPCSTWACAR